MDLTHTSSGPVLLVPTARYHGVCLCVCARLSAVMQTFCKARRVSIREQMVSFFVLSALYISCHPSLSTGRINTFSSTSFNPPAPQTPKTQLMSSSVVLRMADFNIYQVINNIPAAESDHVHLFALNAFIVILCVCVCCRCQRQTSVAKVQKR